MRSQQAGKGGGEFSDVHMQAPRSAGKGGRRRTEAMHICRVAAHPSACQKYCPAEVPSSVPAAMAISQQKEQGCVYYRSDHEIVGFCLEQKKRSMQRIQSLRTVKRRTPSQHGWWLLILRTP